MATEEASERACGARALSQGSGSSGGGPAAARTDSGGSSSKGWESSAAAAAGSHGAPRQQVRGVWGLAAHACRARNSVCSRGWAGCRRPQPSEDHSTTRYHGFKSGGTAACGARGRLIEHRCSPQACMAHCRHAWLTAGMHGSLQACMAHCRHAESVTLGLYE
jgi:hypothetical protein